MSRKTVKIQGYFYEDLEDEGKTAVYWFGNKTIRGSSISMEDRFIIPDNLNITIQIQIQIQNQSQEQSSPLRRYILTLI
jgi:hypothetical protein